MSKTDYFEQARLCFENEEYEQAKALFEKAADKGNADAMFALGTMYLEGKGVPKDIKMAKSWIIKAKHNNHPVAMFYWDIVKGLTQEEILSDG